NDQHYLFLARLHVGIWTRIGFVRTELTRRLPGVNLNDVFQLLGVCWGIRVADTFYFPELPEVTTPEIGGKFAPEKFAAHFVIEADQVCLDELRVSFQKRNRIGRNQLQIWNQ